MNMKKPPKWGEITDEDYDYIRRAVDQEWARLNLGDYLWVEKADLIQDIAIALAQSNYQETARNPSAVKKAIINHTLTYTLRKYRPGSRNYKAVAIPLYTSAVANVSSLSRATYSDDHSAVEVAEFLQSLGPVTREDIMHLMEGDTKTQVAVERGALPNAVWYSMMRARKRYEKQEES